MGGLEGAGRRDWRKHTSFLRFAAWAWSSICSDIGTAPGVSAPLDLHTEPSNGSIVRSAWSSPGTGAVRVMAFGVVIFRAMLQRSFDDDATQCRAQAGATHLKVSQSPGSRGRSAGFAPLADNRLIVILAPFLSPADAAKH